MPTCELIDTREPTEEEARLARESARTLSPYSSKPREMRLQIVDDGHPGETVTLPPVVVDLLNRILTQLAAGNALTLIPRHAELTTQQAANFLNVSRPFLVGLLEKGELRYRKVGTHRRIAFQELYAYRERSLKEGHDRLDELAAEAQELKMGY